MATAKPKPSRAEKKRLTLELSVDAYERLSKLSDDGDKKMADILRYGLALYDIAIEAQKNNQGIGVVEKDKVIKEILVL